MKKALDRLRKENEEQSAEIVSSSSHACKRASTRQLSSTGTSSRVYEAVCIFCDKNSKYRKREKSRENLVKCVDLRADGKIRKVSIEKGDRKIIALVSRELVAAEAHYHRSGYKEQMIARISKMNVKRNHQNMKLPRHKLTRCYANT